MSLGLPWIGVGIIYLIYQMFPLSFNSLFLINIWVFSLPHTFSTFSRSDRRSGKSLLSTFLMLSIFFMSVVAATNITGMVAVYSFYFYWQQFHYGKQNLGVALSASREKSKPIDHFFYLSVVLFSLMGLFTGGAQSFFGYVLIAPSVSFVSKIGLFGIIITLTAIYSIIRPSGRLHAISHSLIFSFSYLYCEHFAVGWLMMNVFHNIQYLEFMKKFEKNLSFLIAPVVLTGLFFILQGHVIDRAILFSLPLGVGIMLSMNFTHYTLDAFIWKRRI